MSDAGLLARWRCTPSPLLPVFDHAFEARSTMTLDRLELLALVVFAALLCVYVANCYFAVSGGYMPTSSDEVNYVKSVEYFLYYARSNAFQRSITWMLLVVIFPFTAQYKLFSSGCSKSRLELTRSTSSSTQMLLCRWVPSLSSGGLSEATLLPLHCVRPSFCPRPCSWPTAPPTRWRPFRY